MMTKNDLMILACLRKNSRDTLTKMSKKTRIPISTIFDKVKTHEQGIIRKFTSLIDFTMLGFNTVATIALRVKKEERETIRDFLIKHQNVNTVYKVNNGFDFMVEVVFRHIKDLEAFIEGLDERFKIKAKQTFYIIDEVKREGFMSEPELLDIIA